MQRKCNEKNDWPNGFYRLRWSSSMPMYGSLCRGLFRTSKNPYACFSRSGSYDKKTHWPKLGREGCANEDVSRASCHQCLWAVRPKSFIKWRQCFTPLVSCLSTLSAIAWENRWRRFASSRFFSATANSHLQYTRWNSVDVYVYVYIYLYIYTYIYYIYLERSWDVLTDAYYSNLNQHPNWSHQLRPWHIRIGDYVQVGPLQGPTESYVSDRKGALNIKILWITLNSLTKPDSMFSIEKLWMKSRII